MYLFLFVIACLLNLYAIKYGDLLLNLMLRVVIFTFLLLFYTETVKKVNYVVVGVLVMFLLSSIFFTLSPTSLYGILALSVVRVGLVKVALDRSSKKNKISWKLLSGVTSLFVGFGIIVLYLHHNDSLFFYYSVLATVFLIILASISFLNVLIKPITANIEFFIAIALTIISDTIFGTQKMTKISAEFLVLASLLYNASYYLICHSEILRAKKIVE